MSHEHRRSEDPEPQSKPEMIDTAYKVGKVGLMIIGLFVFLATVRDRLEAIPKQAAKIEKLERRVDRLGDQIHYLVGGMEAMTGRKYKPRRHQPEVEAND